MSTPNLTLPPSVSYYDENWLYLFELYESLHFPVIHKGFLRFLPSAGSLCLDIGSGSGRDAAALARRGYKVVAVEPSDKLRNLAMQAHPDPNIVWIKDNLPDLTVTKQMKQKFKFILLSAVWMHLQPHERLSAIRALAEHLEKRGFLAITLRLGPEIGERGIFPVSVDELLSLASQVGLKVVYTSRGRKDAFRRTDVQWKNMVFSN